MACLGAPSLRFGDASRTGVRVGPAGGSYEPCPNGIPAAETAATRAAVSQCSNRYSRCYDCGIVLFGARSSVAEQSAHNRSVAGSIPAGPIATARSFGVPNSCNPRRVWKSSQPAQGASAPTQQLLRQTVPIALAPLSELATLPTHLNASITLWPCMALLACYPLEAKTTTCVPHSAIFTPHDDKRRILNNRR